MSTVRNLHFIFDRMPDNEGCTFIEVETESGESVCAGEWRNRHDGNAELVVPVYGTATLQSELAALREELAEWKARSGRRTAERTQFMNERDEYKQANALLIESCAEKFDLLTAAEQRNAEHIKVLLTFASCADVRRVGTGAMDYVAKLGAFKPTESGASE